jgi:hypothetical protein
MDNRSHEETDWDLDVLGLELAELKGLELDLSLTCFDGAEIDRMLLASGEGDEKANAAPHSQPSPPRSKAICGTGDHIEFCSATPRAR